MTLRLRPAVTGPAFAYLCIVTFYFWTASTSGFPASPAPTIGEHYSYLARGFAAGQLSLSVAPSPQLLALPDPYDPAANAHLRLHDAALYKGRYFLYFGPTPALLLFTPFRLVTGLDFPQSLAVALFASAGLLFAFLLVRWLLVMFMPRPPSGWWLTGMMFALGFCSTLPFLLRRTAMYEVAIASGYAFVVASLFALATGGLGDRPRPGRLALGSLLLGLAGGARFPLLAAGVAALAVALRWLLEPTLDRRRRVAVLIALFAPVGVCVLLLGWYNYARFGSWSEFGIRYTLQGVHPGVYQFFSLPRLAYGLAYYTIVPVDWGRIFPFARLDPAHYLTPPPYLYVEPAAGIFAHSPLLLVLFTLPWVRPQHPRLLAAVLVSLLLGGGLLLLFSITGTTMRYEVDFATFFVAPALVLWRQALDTGAMSGSRVRHRLIQLAFCGLLVASVAPNLFISFTGYYDNLRASRPETYDAVRRLFLPVEALMGRPLVVREIRSPNGLERMNDESFFWLGGSPAEITVQSRRRGDVLLSATIIPGPAAAPRPTRRIRIVARPYGWTSEIDTPGGLVSVRIPLVEDVTVISLEALDAVSVPVQPNGDRRPLVAGIRGLRIEPAP